MKTPISYYGGKQMMLKYILETRLEQTQIECDDALKVIQRYDRENSFHYVDPPIPAQIVGKVVW